MLREAVTKKQVEHLARFLGIGAMLIDFDKIDYSMGRGILEGSNRCLWTKAGQRITISLSSDGGVIAGQAKEPDTERPTEPFDGVGE